MKYNRQFEDIINRLLLEAKEQDEISFKEDILTLSDIYAKKNKRLERIIKLSDKQQMAILELNEELDDYKQNLEKRVAEEIQKRQEQEELLMEQSRLATLAEMIDAVAHQWTQPLNVLATQIELLHINSIKQHALSSDEICTFKENATMQIMHMSKTLSSFRNFFKPMHDAVPFSVKAMIEDALELMKNDLLRAKITLLLEVEEDFELIGNESEFKHIIINLLSNAKYAFEEQNISSRNIHIRILGASQRFEVIDNAGGIAPDIMDTIFDLRSSTKGEKGSGIGLYMSAQIAQKHHGELLAENTKDGAKFTFILKDTHDHHQLT